MLRMVQGTQRPRRGQLVGHHDHHRRRGDGEDGGAAGGPQRRDDRPPLLQATHSRAKGSAFNRGLGMGWWQRSQVP